MVGVIQSLHGTRDAAVTWQHYLTEHSQEPWSVSGMFNACAFHNDRRNISVFPRGDDGWTRRRSQAAGKTKT